MLSCLYISTFEYAERDLESYDAKRSHSMCNLQCVVGRRAP